MSFPKALDPIRSLQAAWRLLFASFGPLFIGGVILTLLDSGGGLNFIWDDHREFGERLGTTLIFGGCCGLIGLLVTSWIAIGFAHSVADTMKRGSCAFEGVFDSRGRYGDMLLASFLLFLLHTIAFLPFVAIGVGAHLFESELDVPEPLVILGAIASALVYLPVMLYVLLGFTFVPQAVALEDKGAIDAFKRSWELARGHRLALFFFWLALVVFTLLGICFCCVGVLFTGTLANVAANEAFLTWTRGNERPGWWIGGGLGGPSPTVATAAHHTPAASHTPPPAAVTDAERWAPPAPGSWAPPPVPSGPPAPPPAS